MPEKIAKQVKELRIMQVYRDSVADGLGLRTVIFFAGCGQVPKCPLCQNPEAWAPTTGKIISMNQLVKLAIQTKNNEITFSGGDPLTFQFDNALKLAKILKTKYHKNIWVYTGYSWDFVRKSKKLSQILPYIDVLVDGRFVNKLKDISLKFRGSSNQHIINVPESLKQHRMIDVVNQIE